MTPAHPHKLAVLAGDIPAFGLYRSTIGRGRRPERRGQSCAASDSAVEPLGTDGIQTLRFGRKQRIIQMRAFRAAANILIFEESQDHA